MIMPTSSKPSPLKSAILNLKGAVSTDNRSSKRKISVPGKYTHTV